MDAAHRKFVFSEEYLPGTDRSIKEPYNKEDRESGVRRRTNSGKKFADQRSRLGKVKVTMIAFTCPYAHDVFLSVTGFAIL